MGEMKDTEMKDTKEEEEAKPAEVSESKDPTAHLDKEALDQLTNGMGFSLLRAQKGLLYGEGNTLEGAIEWLMNHQDDADIDEPIKEVKRLTPEEKAAKIE